MNSKQLSLAGAILIVAAIALWMSPNPALSQQAPVPKDFTFDQTKPLGPVTFSHKFHVTEKKLQCPDCHTKIFQMKRVAASQMKMANLNKGEYCGTCHNGKKAFGTKDTKDCGKCHAKK